MTAAPGAARALYGLNVPRRGSPRGSPTSADTERTVHYCEQLLAVDGFEPWNAYTNLAFALAALLGWLAFRRAGLGHAPVARALPVLTLCIAVGSFAWHATGAAWAQWADVLPILGFVLVFLAAALRRLCGFGAAGAGTACAVLVGAAVLVTIAFGPALNGSITYVPVWFGLLGLTLHLRLRRAGAWPAFALATLLFAVSLTMRSIDLACCAATHSHGTHWLWHLCNAWLLAWLMQTYVRHAPPPA